jgi:hypothetical protein
MRTGFTRDTPRRRSIGRAISRRARTALTCLAVTFGVTTLAHHSFYAEYFEEQRVTVEGTVVEFEYRNPHAWVHVMAAAENGAPQRVSAEWSNPARLRQQGLSVESIKPGDFVILTGSPGRDPAKHRIHLRSIERPADGWKWPPPPRR